MNEQHASKFKMKFQPNCDIGFADAENLVPQLEGNYEKIERGFKHGHGEYYIYVFRMGKMIGYDP